MLFKVQVIGGNTINKGNAGVHDFIHVFDIPAECTAAFKKFVECFFPGNGLFATLSAFIQKVNTF